MNSFFGTDGIRATMGTALFTQQNLSLVAQAIGNWLRKTISLPGYRPRVLIIHDTRNSCSYIKSLFKTTFISQSIDVYDAGVLPTPAALYLLQKYNLDCALIISASHNPWHDNGIKIIDRWGKLTGEAEVAITNEIQHPQESDINYLNLGNEYTLNGVSEYFHVLQKLFKTDFLRSLKIIVDCAHGATSVIAPLLFEHFGAEVITLNRSPDGFNINKESGSLNPETLQKGVKEHSADIGFAFDGDGDRIIAVNRQGVIKNGDDIVALLSQHPDYLKETVLVGTSMSNMGLELWLKDRGKELVRADVGDKYVAQKLTDCNALLGGEQSGHIILKNYTHTGDGILVALKVMETMQILKKYDFITFTPFPQVLLAVPVKKMCNLSESPYTAFIETAQELVARGRISVRYSGTEKNMLRIMVESETFQNATTVAQHLATSFQKELA